MKTYRLASISWAVCLMLSADSLRAVNYSWIGTAGTTELWTSTSNWTPAGVPGVPNEDFDSATFDTPSLLLHDIIMPTSGGIQSLRLERGLFQFGNGASPTIWNMDVVGGNIRLATDDNASLELRLRDGRLWTDGAFSMGSTSTNSSTTLDAENASVETVGGALIGNSSTSNSAVLLRLKSSSFYASNLSEVYAGAAVEVIDDSDAFFVSLFSRGDLQVADGGVLEAWNLQLFDDATLTVAAGGPIGGTLDVKTLILGDNSTTTVSGSAGVTAVLDAEDFIQAFGQSLTIGNLGLVRTPKLTGGGINLQTGGRLRVPADEFNVAPVNFNWTGGTLEFFSNYRVDATGVDNPFGANITVATGKHLDVDPFGGSIEVGTSSQGALTISGGVVTSDAGKVGGALNPVGIGPATVTVSGSTGLWNVNGLLTAGGTPGLQSSTINISSGADVVVVEAQLGTPGLRSNVNIDGAGSTLVSSDSVFLGGNATTAGGQGTLALTNGGALGVGNAANDQLKVWEGYTVTMNQGAINTRNLVVRGTIAPAAGAGISGNITAANSVIIDGGSVSLTALGPSAIVASSNVDITAGGSLNGYVQGSPSTEVLVTGAGSAWNTSTVIANVLGTLTSGVGRIGTLKLGPGGTANFGAGVSYAGGATGGLDLFGGTLNAPTFAGGSVGIVGHGTVNANYSGNGPIQATGPLAIGNATNVNGFSTSGTITVGQHALTLNDANAAELGSGALLGSGGAPGTLIAANGLNLGSGKTVFGYGTINTPNDSAARVLNDGSMSGSGTAQRLTLAGFVTGVGSFTNVEFTGTFAPANVTAGSEAGIVTGSNYKFTPTSDLQMTIGGPNPGFGYDVIFSTGQFLADGKLTVALTNGFTPTLGQSFDLLDFDTLVGTFDMLSLPVLPGLAWNTSQLYTQGRLSVGLPPILEADFEEDGDVDHFDLAVWQGSLGSFSDGGASHAEGDATGEGTVDGRDFLVWQRQFGQVPEQTVVAAVPEPRSLSIVGACAIVRSVVRVCRRDRQPSQARYFPLSGSWSCAHSPSDSA